jgi:hypothetical protein
MKPARGPTQCFLTINVVEIITVEIVEGQAKCAKSYLLFELFANLGIRPRAARKQNTCFSFGLGT